MESYIRLQSSLTLLFQMSQMTRSSTLCMVGWWVDKEWHA